eukprot:SAG31_NODE_886_length_11229_cov_19.134142_9_plen_97_part_00
MHQRGSAIVLIQSVGGCVLHVLQWRAAQGTDRLLSLLERLVRVVGILLVEVLRGVLVRSVSSVQSVAQNTVLDSPPVLRMRCACEIDRASECLAAM